jgi:hypothetical protein
MVWPPTTHQDVQDETDLLRVLYGFEGTWPSGSYLQPDGVISSGTLVADRVYYGPLWVPSARTVTSMEVDCTAAGAGGTPTIRLGLYLPDAAGRPGALLVDAGTVDATLTGLLAKTVSQAMPRGLLWTAVVAQGATTTQPQARVLIAQGRFVNFTAVAAAQNRPGYFQASVPGALPATATPRTDSNVGVATLMLLKAA